jgi:hypothetical protein
MTLECVESSTRLLGFKGVVQGGASRGVEISHDAGEALGMGVAKVDPFLDWVRPVHGGPLLGEVHLALTGQGFKEQEPIADTVALLLDIILLQLAGLAG